MTIGNGTPPPRKTLTISRKPAIGGAGNANATNTAPPAGTVTRTGKRIITREQLPTIAAPRPKPPKPKATTKDARRKPRQPPKPKKTPPSDLKARELNDRLNGFDVWLNYQPLSIGVDQEIFRLVNDECFPGASKSVVQKTLAMHCGHGRYLQGMTGGGARFRLDGAEDGEITHYQRMLARERLEKRGVVMAMM